jgi:hypothetical protein
MVSKVFFTLNPSESRQQIVNGPSERTGSFASSQAPGLLSPLLLLNQSAFPLLSVFIVVVAACQGIRG